MKSNAEFYYQRSMVNLDNGKVEDSISDLDTAIALAPHNTKYHIERGVLRYRTGQYELAFDDITYVIENSIELEEIIEAYKL